MRNFFITWSVFSCKHHKEAESRGGEGKGEPGPPSGFHTPALPLAGRRTLTVTDLSQLLHL